MNINPYTPLIPLIEQYWEMRDHLTPKTAPIELKNAVDFIIQELEIGRLRVASLEAGEWYIHTWIKQAILLYFRLYDSQVMPGSLSNCFDKIPLRFQNHTLEAFQQLKIRVVPPSCVRMGAYIGPNVVLMPSYINIGAYIGESTMIDTWATIGSCAQIGKHVHISGGVGIGGVLEPLQAAPTIIEDHCFIGARSEIVEGVIVEKNSVISMGVYIGQSTKIYHREKDEVTYGRIPEGSVVVSGSLPGKTGKAQLYCAVIVKTVDEKTRSKTSINQLLRDYV